MKDINSICILGAGNMATHIGKAIKDAGIDVLQVYNRTEKTGKKLAKLLGCEFISDLNTINEKTGLILFAVSDDAIAELLKLRRWDNMLLVHTSGSTPQNVFKTYTNRFGIIYPLQTFSKERHIIFNEIPLFVEGNSKETLSIIQNLAKRISHTVIEIDSDKRCMLHLAAVFTNNFSNHMYTIAFNLLKQNNLPFKYLGPLIKETMHKVLEMEPNKTQTGPAIRNEKKVIRKHLEMLSKEPEWQKIYTFVSRSIQKYHNSRHD